MTTIRRKAVFGALLTAGVVLSGCSDQGEPVAYVNGGEISQSDYLSTLESSRAGGSPAGLTALNNLVQQELLVQEAKKQGVAPTREELNAAYARIKDDPQNEESLRQMGLTQDQVIRLYLAPSFSVARLVAKMAGVTEKDITDYFAAHKKEMRQPESVRARVLQAADRKKAEEALKLIPKSGFETVARTFGVGVSAGRVETLRKSSMSTSPNRQIEFTPKQARCALFCTKI